DFTGSAGARLDGDRALASRAELGAAARKIKTAVDLGQLYNDYYEEGLRLFPMKATFAGDHRYNDQLPNSLSEEYRAAVKVFFERYLARLHQFDRGTLPPKEQVHYDVLEWECEIELASFRFSTELMPMNQMS